MSAHSMILSIWVNADERGGITLTDCFATVPILLKLAPHPDAGLPVDVVVCREEGIEGNVELDTERFDDLPQRFVKTGGAAEDYDRKPARESLRLREQRAAGTLERSELTLRCRALSACQ